MLILTRRAAETLFIGTDVAVTVLDIRGDRVRLGIVAPRSVEVQREERGRQLGPPTPSPEVRSPHIQPR